MFYIIQIILLLTVATLFNKYEQNIINFIKDKICK